MRGRCTRSWVTSRASTRAAAVAARGATAELVHDGQLSGRGQGGNEVRLLEDDADLLPSQIRGLARGELGGIEASRVSCRSYVGASSRLRAA